MARPISPLLLGVFIVQLQYHTGYAQFYEPYQSQPNQGGVSTSFINQPVSSINPYPKFNTAVDNRGVQTVEQSTYYQPLSSGTGQVTYTVQDGRFTAHQQQPQQQQQFIGGGQSTVVRQQPSSLGVFNYPVAPETRTISNTQQQFSSPNFIYSSSNQGQLSQSVDTSSIPIQREFVYPVGGISQQTVNRPTQIQFVPRTQTSISQASNENYVPIQNIRPSLPENSEVVTFGDSPFVITQIKPKSTQSVQVLQSGRNPLESLKSEAIIEALLNRANSEGGRTNQIIVNTKSDIGRIPVTELPITISTTPIAVTTQPPPSPTPSESPTPTERIASSTTPMPLPPTTTTTTTPPPPPVHVEVTTTEERHYVSRKKKITVFIRVEDAGFDAEEKENYATKQDFHEWTKTIVEPTDIYEEKKTFLKNETREVEGPSVGLDVTKVICRNIIDDKETVVELDLLKDNSVCPRPALNALGSWEERAFYRIDREIERKLKDIFNVTKESLHPLDGSYGSFKSPILSTARSGVRAHVTDPTGANDGFLQKTIDTIINLAPEDHKERHFSPVTSKRDTEKPRHLVEDHDLEAAASEVKLSTDTTSQHGNRKVPPNQTSKRETKPEIVEEVKLEEVKTEQVKTGEVKTREVKTEEFKSGEVKTDEDKIEVKSEEDIIEPTMPTTQSHIMLITRAPPVRTPNPYHHHSTTPALPEEVPTKSESLPVAHALSSSIENVPSKPEENKEKTFFRRST